jgi:hypothetical protein
MKLAAIHLYPVKSMRGLDLDAADVEARGLHGDRRWMLVDARSRFVTARQHPMLLRFAAERIRAGLVIFAPDGSVRDVAEPGESAPTLEVGIWKSSSPARVADAATNAWLSQQLGIEVRLVHMGDDCVRAVSAEWSEAGDMVSFADGFPLLLIGSASLDLLNSKLARPVSMANFRPNLVVETSTPHVEDQWRRIRIGDCEFALPKPCTRCVLTTIDPLSAMPAADGEPLATLKQYRREALGVTFGQNLLVRAPGRIEVGMPVELVE